jgi:hypothetical protein
MSISYWNSILSHIFFCYKSQLSSTSDPYIQSWLWYNENIIYNNIKSIIRSNLIFILWFLSVIQYFTLKTDNEIRCKEGVFYPEDGASMFSETFILIYKTTWYHIPENCKPSKQQARNNAVCLKLVACFFNLLTLKTEVVC